MSGNVVSVTSTTSGNTYDLEAVRDPDGGVNLVDHARGRYYQRQ